MNAKKHGERSAENIVARRQLNAALRELREYDGGTGPQIEGDLSIWTQRIGAEIAGL